jgi:hypothetical protein
MWHGYFVVQRGTVGISNWNDLIAVYNEMGTHDSRFPAQNTHKRTRLDGDAVIYESLFAPDEVSVDSFKEILADEFGVPVENIEHTTAVVDYAGHDTTRWEFLYNAIVRFSVERFGRGGSWQQSGDECRGYLAANRDEWEPQEA